jgi:type IV pilus assembly protein PilB
MATGELVPFTEEIRDWMIQRRSFGDIRSGIRQQGVASIRDNALALAARGLTSLHEVNRVTSVEEG